jgi:pimeloyl-ACP methyl ester carboxylesterase
MLLAVVALLLVLLVVAVLVFQRRLIYFPAKLTADAARQLAIRNGFVAWRNRSGDTIGWQLPAARLADRAVLVVHGNAGSAIHRDYFARPIRAAAAAADVFILEYPGYGVRGGSPGRDTFLAAAEEAFDVIPSPTPVFVVGESLGCGVATHLARTRAPRVAGLVLFAPYNTLVEVAQTVVPILPMGLLLRDQFNPAEDLKHYNGPVEIVLAGADEVIPPESGRRLYDGYTGPKHIEIMPGARHNDIISQPPEWWKTVFAFWQHHKATPATAN